MRVIGQVHGESRARVFSDFLFVEGIENEIESGSDDHWSIWVHDESELDEAGEHLKQFQSNPDNPRYSRASDKAGELKQKTAEEQKAWEKRLRGRRHLFQPLRGYGFGPLTFALIVVSTIVFIVSEMASDPSSLSFLYISNPDSVGGGWMARVSALPEIRSGEVWRIITPIFIHMSILHLVFNMLWLRDLGSMIEDRQSTLQLALLVFVLAATSNFAQYIMAGPGFGGMSGVVYGLLGYIWIRGRFDPGSGLLLHQSTVVMMMIWLVVCFTGVVGPIANTAHVVGLLVGVAWAFLASLKYR